MFIFNIPSRWPSFSQHFLPLLHVDISVAVHYLHLSTFTLLQPLAPPPLTQPKTSPNICPLSPAAKPTGELGMAAPGHSTCLSPPTSFQSTQLEAICPLADWATSNPLHLFAPGVCRIPPLLGEVITLAVSKWNSETVTFLPQSYNSEWGFLLKRLIFKGQCTNPQMKIENNRMLL